MEAADISNRARCLIVDDDEPVAALLVEVLSQDGFLVDCVNTGEEALELCKANDFAIVILDFELPGISGQQVCRLIREFSDVYIMMVTSRSSEVDRVLSLSLGADDYMVKPFSLPELLARVRALLRRSRMTTKPIPANPVALGTDELVIDHQARTVSVRGNRVPVTALEFELLETLAAQIATAVPRSALMEAGWGPEWGADDHLVDVHIFNLRRKLEQAGAELTRIENIRGFGFRLVSNSSN